MTFDDLRRLAVKDRMSRREFVQLAIASGASAALAQNMFESAKAAEPKKGGLFRAGVGHGSTTDSLNPATWENIFVGDFGAGLMGDTLVDIDTSNSPTPNLAVSFEPADGAKKWVFKLRKGVEFHNGKSLTADDVIATYNHHRGENSKSAVKSVLKSVTDIKADGPDTVIFNLEAGSADFPYITSDYHLPIFPAKDDGSIEWENGVGTGAYMLAKRSDFDPGVKIRCKRNANYHGTAWFDQVEMLAILDVVARTNAFNSGDIHYMDRCDLKTLHLLKRNPNANITNKTGFAHYVAPMNVTVAPFDNVDVRTAIKHCFKRDEIVQKVLFGHGISGNDNPIAPSIKYAVQPEPVHKFDPDKAKFHLKRAGLTSLDIELSASDAAFAGAMDTAVLMSEHAKACNINIKVKREAKDGYWSNVWMNKPWCFAYWGGRPTADWMFTTAYAADANWNDTFWKHERFNELLVTARAETDDAKRAAMYAEMQAILHNDGGILVLMFNNYVSAVSKKIGHGELNSNYDHDGGYMFQRWWFTS